MQGEVLDVLLREGVRNQWVNDMEQPKMSEPRHDPIPLDLCRELLAGETESLSDEEVELIRRHADAMAHLLIEIAVQRQSEG